jgi:hypothetical protein
MQGNISTTNGLHLPPGVLGHDLFGMSKSEVLDWAHAGHSPYMWARGSVALRRISAGDTVELGNEVWFERGARTDDLFWKALDVRQFMPGKAWGQRGKLSAISAVLPAERLP